MLNRHTGGWSWLLGCAMVIGCDPELQPGLELQVLVVGNATAGERAKRIDVVFNRSMVGEQVLGQVLPIGENAPFRLVPDVPGALRWREDRRLSFEPAQPLPRATKFSVIVPKGTRTAENVGLNDDFEFEFETERLSLTTELVRDFSLPDPKQWATPGQKLALSFNQPVLSERVKAACQFRSVDGAVNVGSELTTPGEAAREQFEVAPREPLRAGTPFRFSCDPNLAPVEGPLGFAPAEPAKDAGGQRPSGALDFSTFGPFKAEGISPSGQAVDPDEQNVSVRFSTPPLIDTASNPIQIEPRPDDVSLVAHVSGSELSTRVNGLSPLTEYTIRVAARLRDAFGQTLTEPYAASFRTGSVAPGYALDTGSWAVESSREGYVAWARNVKKVEVLAASLSEQQLFAVLPQLTWWDREAVDLEALKIPVTKKQLEPRGEPHRYNQLLLSPKGLLGDAAGKSRFYYIASRAPEVLDRDETDDAGNPLPQGYAEVLLNVTNLGVTSKLSGNSGLVWVTRLSDGAAQAGAEVSVREGSGAVLWRGTTDADGTVALPGRAALLAKSPAAKSAQNTDEEGEESEGGGEHARLLIFARLGDDMTFVDPDRTGAFAPWSFGVQNDTVPKEFALRGFLHTDRGLYRPGDAVQLRGLARLLKLGGGLFVPPGASAEVIVSDPRDRELSRRRIPLSSFGGFNLTHVLAETAALGDYRVRAVLPHGEFSETFTVEEFRAATFEVELRAKQKQLFAGESVKVSSLGRYFYGAPVRNADVTVRVHSRARSVAFAGYDEYSFSDEGSRYGSVRPYGDEALITERALKLDDKGSAEHEIELRAEQFVSPSTLLISATVQDETNQTVSANLTLPLHKARLYLGVDSGGWVAVEKAPERVRFVALDPEGRPVSATAKYSVQKENWSCAWERWGYLGSYRCEAKPEVIATGPLVISADKPLEQHVTYPGPGEYSLRIEGVDARGEAVRAARSIWVSGDGESQWRVDDSARFQIVADKNEYRVGDTAKLILQTPTRGASALITVERDGVISRRNVPELAPGQPISIPITEAFAPNAFVSVVLHRGRTGEGARGLPKASMGLINLPVSHADKRLVVKVSTDQAEYRPGGPVKVQLRVTDTSGKPVRAEIALAAADEGVLSLINFKTPDPLTTFFAPWGLAVSTASQYERLTQIPAPDQERYVTGGDSAGMPGSLRSRFRATAYWNPAVLTDAQGEATLSFDAPDNLTAFRLMAVAADATDHFGSGEQRFVVNKPLQLISALPRFASVGDRFEAAALVTNDTGQAAVAKVRFAVDGAVLIDRAGNSANSAEKEISLPAAGRQRVAFPVVAKEPGSARFRFAASMPGHEDGLELSIPVQYPSSEESQLLSEGMTQASVNLAVRLPEGILAKSAYLDISVDPDGLAGIEDGLRDLVQYPYGCLEQTTSRLIPLVAAKELTRSLRLAEIEGDKLERYIQIALAKILRHQTASGGFGLWPGSEPEAYLTAYALWGMKLAGDAGYALDAPAIARATDYLRMQLNMEARAEAAADLGYELSSRAFSVYVLALMGQPEPGLASALAGRADAMPHFGQAFLARALAASVGPTHASVTALLDRFHPTPTGKGSGVVVNERGDVEFDWYLSSHVRTSAIVTDTLLSLRPDDARLPGLIRGLLDLRRAHGSWYTTQENLYALVALTHYAKARAGNSATVRISRGDQTLLAERLAGNGLGRLRRVEVPVDAADTRPLSVTSSEGTVYYRVRARYMRDAAHQSALDNGLPVKRVFLDPETGAVLEQAREGQMVRVQLTLSAREQQDQVALSDYLPAGLEPINARFATAPNNLPKDDPDWYHRLWLTHRELRDERVDAFVNWLPARPGTFEYLTRATSVGTFVVPAATAEAMYDPDVNGRTEPRTFEIVARP